MVEQVAVASALVLEEAQVVAGGGYRVVGQTEQEAGLARLPGILHPDAPNGRVRWVAEGPNVSAKVDQGVLEAVLLGQFGHAIHGVFLAESTEVQPHAFFRQVDGAPVPLDFFPAHLLGLKALIGAIEIFFEAVELLLALMTIALMPHLID